MADGHTIFFSEMLIYELCLQRIQCYYVTLTTQYHFTKHIISDQSQLPAFFFKLLLLYFHTNKVVIQLG